MKNSNKEYSIGDLTYRYNRTNGKIYSLEIVQKISKKGVQNKYILNNGEEISERSICSYNEVIDKAIERYNYEIYLNTEEIKRAEKMIRILKNKKQ